MTTPADQDDEPRRRRLVPWIAGGSAVLLCAAGITWGVLSAQSSTPPSTPHTLVAVGTPVPSAPAITGPTATGAPKSSDAPKGADATPTPDPRFGAPVAETVTTGDSSSFGGGVTVSVSPFTEVDVKASGPGEVNGPGMKATVVVKNGGSKPVDLSSLSVNGYYGDDYTPASPVASQTTGLSGALAAGEQASGEYVFSVPKGSESAFRVTVGSGSSSLVLVK
ncbi:DUF4352 domain-containing protein [Leifsonia sp. fls2-241-R2A-40a]|uniref:DUF4352 domain-containing protein n=1 Tax=Leifsonia sp. fls2-241-R2A-40a TaxID=3040290 RepID=UPI00254CD59D|nr:DUF4352 domain-containing protein [Leifsonia sp. fls2-241-R2A-40a]